MRSDFTPCVSNRFIDSQYPSFESSGQIVVKPFAQLISASSARFALDAKTQFGQSDDTQKYLVFRSAFQPIDDALGRLWLKPF